MPSATGSRSAPGHGRWATAGPGRAWRWQGSWVDSVGNVIRGKQQGRIAGPILAGAAAGLGAEAADEMALVEEAQLLGQARHRQLRAGQQLAGTLDAAAAHVAQRAGTGAATEQAHQVEAADTGRLRQLCHPQP